MKLEALWNRPGITGVRRKKEFVGINRSLIKETGIVLRTEEFMGEIVPSEGAYPVSGGRRCGTVGVVIKV